MTRRAWLEYLPQLHAERDLRFADLSGYSLDAIESLAALATGDAREARRIRLAIYKRRLLAGG